MAAHHNRAPVQDPYSLRCQPQVMGACLDAMRFAARTLEIEPTRSPTTRSCSRKTATSSRAEISTPSRWPSAPTSSRSRWPRSARSPSGASPSRRRQLERPAAVSGRGERAQLRLHGGADLRGGARVGEQVARAPGERRQHPDRRQPGRPRQHGDVRRAAAGRDRRQRARHRRDRADRRRAGRSTSRGRTQTSPPLARAHGLVRERVARLRPGSALRRGHRRRQGR